VIELDEFESPNFWECKNVNISISSKKITVILPGNQLQHPMPYSEVQTFSISFIFKDHIFLQALCQIFVDRSARFGQLITCLGLVPMLYIRRTLPVSEIHKFPVLPFRRDLISAFWKALIAWVPVLALWNLQGILINFEFWSTRPRWRWTRATPDYELQNTQV
jgi:hypothetical protein